MTPAELKSAIRSLGCAQQDIARHIGIAPETLSRITRGKTRAVPRYLALLIGEWLGPAPVDPPGRRGAGND
jgi:transcriptional regulator with XRE-family HTH domain